MRKIYLLNALSDKKEEFVVRDFKTVNIYSCCPSLHGTPRLVDLRTCVFVDTLERVLSRTREWTVNAVTNAWCEEEAFGGACRPFQAAEEGLCDARKSLNCLRREEAPRVPRPLMRANNYAEVVERRGFAYRGLFDPGNLYFDAKAYGNKFGGTGEDGGLSFPARKETAATAFVLPTKRSIGGIAAPDFPSSSRDSGSPLSNKILALGSTDRRAPGDVLLRRSRECVDDDGRRQPATPGRHLACAAAASLYFGDCVDVHVGGVDSRLHHDVAIAVCRASFGDASCVRFGVLVGPVCTDGGDLVRETTALSKLSVAGYSPMAVRWLFLSRRYSDRIRVNEDDLAEAQAAYSAFFGSLADLKRRASETQKFAECPDPTDADLEDFSALFWALLENDLDTASALGALVQYVERLASGKCSCRFLNSRISYVEELVYCYLGLLKPNTKATVDELAVCSAKTMRDVRELQMRLWKLERKFEDARPPPASKDDDLPSATKDPNEKIEDVVSDVALDLAPVRREKKEAEEDHVAAMDAEENYDE